MHEKLEYLLNIVLEGSMVAAVLGFFFFFVGGLGYSFAKGFGEDVRLDPSLRHKIYQYTGALLVTSVMAYCFMFLLRSYIFWDSKGLLAEEVEWPFEDKNRTFVFALTFAFFIVCAGIKKGLKEPPPFGQ